MEAAKSLKELIAETIGRSSLQLPVFNPVAMELRRALADERASLREVEAMIVKDPALAGQVLRMANSAAFAGLGDITTMKQALVRLGIRPVARLAIAASQASLYRPQDPLGAAYMKDLWRHAYACALGASWIAERTGRPELADAAFLAGLLHDIGKLLILRALADLGAHAPGGAPAKPLVDELLETLHPELGFQLMKRWNLPEAYCEVARDHMLEEACQTGDAARPLLVIVRLVDQVCAKLGLGYPAQPEAVPAASPEAQALGLNEVRLAELEIHLEDNVAAAGV